MIEFSARLKNFHSHLVCHVSEAGGFEKQCRKPWQNIAKPSIIQNCFLTYYETVRQSTKIGHNSCNTSEKQNCWNYAAEFFAFW